MLNIYLELISDLEISTGKKFSQTQLIYAVSSDVRGW